MIIKSMMSEKDKILRAALMKRPENGLQEKIQCWLSIAKI